MRQLKPFVFFVPFVLLLFSMGYSLLDSSGFLASVKGMNDWILRYFGWLFSAGTLLFVALCIWVYFSPLAKVRIGGKEAKPILTRWQWFSIILCTTIAIGILFWSRFTTCMRLPEGLEWMPIRRGQPVLPCLPCLCTGPLLLTAFIRLQGLCLRWGITTSSNRSV